MPGVKGEAITHPHTRHTDESHHCLVIRTNEGEISQTNPLSETLKIEMNFILTALPEFPLAMQDEMGNLTHLQLLEW